MESRRVKRRLAEGHAEDDPTWQFWVLPKQTTAALKKQKKKKATDNGDNAAKLLFLRGPGGIKGTVHLSKTDDYSKETLQGHLRAFRAKHEAPTAAPGDGDTAMHDAEWTQAQGRTSHGPTGEDTDLTSEVHATSERRKQPDREARHSSRETFTYTHEESRTIHRSHARVVPTEDPQVHGVCCSRPS